MDTIKIDTDFIKLGQLIKLANLVSGGAEAKYFILEGNVIVNNEICLMRGKKIYPGDVVKVKDKEITVSNAYK